MIVADRGPGSGNLITLVGMIVDPVVPYQDARFEVSALRAERFEWFWNDALLPGETGSILNLDNLTLEDTGEYEVVVSNDGGSVTSRVARLTVNPRPSCLPPPGLLAVTVIVLRPGVGHWRGIAIVRPDWLVCIANMPTSLALRARL